MKAAYIVMTFIAASVPLLVPTAGANVIGFGEDYTVDPRGGTLASVAMLAWAMFGARLIKS